MAKAKDCIHTPPGVPCLKCDRERIEDLDTHTLMARIALELEIQNLLQHGTLEQVTEAESRRAWYRKDS